ncbi:MAG: AAA family ATPase, partial [Deltaproteobacteria bacterium]|nr:AAA family ATPase [Deltaproteobacteria bacterium]
MGKSTLVQAWGKSHFESFVKIDLEQEGREVFKSLNPQKIIETISLLKGQAILPGKTLLFIDEIQESSEAIASLRYFHERMPDLHVIGAGSLLEITLRSETMSMPVGRVEFLHLLPISFSEFLTALGEENLQNYLLHISPSESIAEAVHSKLLDLVKTYSIVGGMPAV